MAHDWQPVRKTAATFLKGDMRKCSRCGADQERAHDYAWGRITSTYWWPKVGRCPKDKEERNARKP